MPVSRIVVAVQPEQSNSGQAPFDLPRSTIAQFETCPFDYNPNAFLFPRPTPGCYPCRLLSRTSAQLGSSGSGHDTQGSTGGFTWTIGAHSSLALGWLVRLQKDPQPDDPLPIQNSGIGRNVADLAVARCTLSVSDVEI